jgi:hypothetical protein
MNRAIVAVGAAVGDCAPTLATISAATVVQTITIVIAFTESKAPPAPSEGEVFRTVEDPGFFAAL